jgi:hypothetical protein
MQGGVASGFESAEMAATLPGGLLGGARASCLLEGTPNFLANLGLMSTQSGAVRPKAVPTMRRNGPVLRC